jgi:hypothetical protein
VLVCGRGEAYDLAICSQQAGLYVFSCDHRSMHSIVIGSLPHDRSESVGSRNSDLVVNISIADEREIDMECWQ